MRLWGGRFAGGPAEALAALSRSVALRLAAGAVRPGRRRARTPGCCTAPGCSTTTSWPRCWPRLDDLDADVADGSVPPDRRRRGRAHRARARPGRAARDRSAASCGPAAAATTRSPPTSGSTCATRARSVGRAVADAAGRAARPGRARTSTPPMPGMHPPAARAAGARSPTTCSRTSTRSRATSTGCGDWDARAALGRRSAPARWPARRCRSTRRRSPRSSASPAPMANSIDAVVRPRLRRRVPLRAPRMIGVAPVPDRRGGLPVDHARVRLGRRSTTPTPPGSSIMPQKKNPDVAELARGKAGRLIGNLDRPARHAQGPAARVQPRPAGGQGAGLRHGRHAAAACCRR